MTVHAEAPARRGRLSMIVPATRRCQRSLDPGQSGATLVLALAFTSIIMSLTVVLLGFSRAGNESLHSYQIERVRRYAIDGAAQSAIQMVATFPRMGETGGTDPCTMQYVIKDTGARQLAVPGAYLVVRCVPTPAAIMGGTGVSGTQTGGAQNPRDVTFTVTCQHEPNVAKVPNRIDCGSGTDRVDVAKVRVRYEVDYSWPVPADRARVPKIVTWEVRN